MDVAGSEIMPSSEAFYAARLLGNEMARCEPRLAPNLRNLSQFSDLRHFRRVHRERLEREDAFRPWQERLLNITEPEGRRFGLRPDDSMAAWDVWYNQIAEPLKNAMWTAWETWYALPMRYHAAVAKQRQQQPVATPLQVAARVMDTTHLMEVGAQALAAPETPDSTPQACPATDAPESRTQTSVRRDDSDAGQTAGGVNGIGAHNQVRLDGDSWSV